jgi:hypothetical protein
MENKDTGGALAGGLIAPALMDTLVAKGILTADDARSVLIKARRTIGSHATNAEQRAAAALLDALVGPQPSRTTCKPINRSSQGKAPANTAPG